jgi:hypothetical protein
LVAGMITLIIIFELHRHPETPSPGELWRVRRRRIDAAVAAVMAVHRAADLASTRKPSIYL